MPVARFQMPDGRVARFEVPEGTTPEQAQTMIAQHLGGQSASQPAAPTYSPTEGMSTKDRLLAGIGRGMTSAGRAALQGISKLVGADDVGAGLVKQSEIDDAKKYDAPLLNTTAGKVGNVLGNAAIAAPTALIPGANTYQGAALIGAGLGGLTTEGGLDERLKGAAFGGAGGLAGKGLGDALGAGAKWVANRAADKFATATAANAQKQIAAKSMAEAGYVIPPADLNPGMMTEALSGLSGKIKTAQVASAKNQPITNAMARKELGLSADTPLTLDTLTAIRRDAGQAYEAVSSAGTIQPSTAYDAALDKIVAPYAKAAQGFPNAKPNPIISEIDSLRSSAFDAGSAVAKIKELRGSADAAYAQGNKDAGKAFKDAAAAIENAIDEHLTKTGAPADLLNAFRDARTTIAKTYSVQKALNTQTGDVSAIALAKQLDKGKPLSGDLLKVAQAGQAFPKAMQALKETPKATSPLDWAMGGMSAGMMNPAPAMIAAARPAVRAMLLSGPMQRAALTGPSAPGLLSTAPAWMLEKNLTRAMMPGLLSGSLSSN